MVLHHTFESCARLLAC